jgi:hypothetical protein
MYLGRVMTNMWDTCKDLCGIHAGYMYLQWFQDT